MYALISDQNSFFSVWCQPTRLQPSGYFGNCLHFLAGSAQNAEARKSWSADGGHGSDARRVCRRLHRQRHRRFCNATVRNRKFLCIIISISEVHVVGSLSWSRRSSFSSKDVGHVEANWTSRNGGRMVPFPSRIRMLAFWGRHQHTTVVRSSLRESRCCCRRSNSVSERKSRHRRIPHNQSAVYGLESGATPDYQ